MTWINYKNINKSIERNNNGCKFCMEDKREFLIKEGTLVDHDLLFLTYISFVQDDDRVIEIGSYPFNGSDLLSCKKCKSNYYRYFNEGHIGGRPEYHKIDSNWKFDKEKASCSITLSITEINTLSEEFDIVDFKPHEATIKHTFRINSRSLPPLISINQTEIERSPLIRYDLAGDRNLLHDFIRSTEELGKRGTCRKYIRLNKKLMGELEKVQYESDINLVDHLLTRVRKEISHTVHDLSRFEYDKLRERSAEYERCFEQIEVLIGSYSKKIPKLIEKLRVCSQQ